jgi:hypothetical protein
MAADVPERSTASAITLAANSVGGKSLRPPPKSATAVRTPLKITTSLLPMGDFLLVTYLIIHIVGRYWEDDARLLQSEFYLE